jgi:hypothetical protein
MTDQLSQDIIIMAFNAIRNFTTELASVFGDDQRSLKLYAHLIEKTTTAHDKPTRKHIEAFRIFCVSNRDAITNKDSSLLETPNILFSSKVFINMKEIFELADPAASNIVWTHLLTILAIVSPESEAKKILESDATGGEEQFLGDLLSKVENNMSGDNPIAAVSSIVQSGMFAELVDNLGNGLDDGSIKLDKLMHTVQNMAADGPPELKNIIGQLSGGEGGVPDIAGLLGQLSGGEGGAPDIAGLLGQLSGGEGGIPDIAGLLGQLSGGEGGAPDIAGLLGKLSGGEGGVPDIAGLLGQLSGGEGGAPDIAGLLGKLSGGEGGAPDIAGLLGQLSGGEGGAPDIAGLLGQLSGGEGGAPDIAGLLGQLNKKQ